MIKMSDFVIDIKRQLHAMIANDLNSATLPIIGAIFHDFFKRASKFETSN